MDAITNSRLVVLHPALISRYTRLDAACEAKGIRLRITQGFRTFAQEDALYAQGRTLPGKIVTEARGGWSAHNFAYALDAAPDDPNFPQWSPDWDELDARWQELLDLALVCDLSEGARWRTFPDAPHLYLKECPATPTDAMRSAFAQGGLPTVWQMIDEWVGSNS